VKLSNIVNSSEKLKYAQSYSFIELPNEIAAIKLEFETFSCFIGVIEDTDEIELSHTVKVADLISSDISLFFKKCYGLKLCWAWSMVNNQGYSDGLKFEFENKQIVELVVCASSIVQYGVSEL
jgi:hypothetical protein